VGSLSEVQKQLILGCILGDGYLRKKTNAHLQITHSITQKEYVDWKYQILKNLVISKPSSYDGNAGRVGYRFFTKSIPEITFFFGRFYKNGVKKVSKNLYLTPFSLAVWYMDDGSKSRNSCYLNTQNFDLSSQRNLMKALKRLGIKSSLNKDKIYFRIRVAVESVPKMLEMINPYIIRSMRYKLPI
jgi:intein-encoded DNA endonuclease-like protein